jgi:hypothetical protein
MHNVALKWQLYGFSQTLLIAAQAATELIKLPLGGITLPRAGPKNKGFRPDGWTTDEKLNA